MGKLRFKDIATLPRWTSEVLGPRWCGQPKPTSQLLWFPKDFLSLTLNIAVLTGKLISLGQTEAVGTLGKCHFPWTFFLQLCRMLDVRVFVIVPDTP